MEKVYKVVKRTSRGQELISAVLEPPLAETYVSRKGVLKMVKSSMAFKSLQRAMEFADDTRCLEVWCAECESMVRSPVVIEKWDIMDRNADASLDWFSINETLSVKNRMKARAMFRIFDDMVNGPGVGGELLVMDISYGRNKNIIRCSMRPFPDVVLCKNLMLDEYVEG